VPYEIKLVTICRRDGSGALDPANPHPHGKVPTISDDGAVVFESSAIALYLTDQYPKNHLGPLVWESERGAKLTWLSYYSGVREPAIVSPHSRLARGSGIRGGEQISPCLAWLTNWGICPKDMGDDPDCM
jgi:glutathione S-transferase